MQSFIGKPLSDCVAYCKENNLEFSVIINSNLKENEQGYKDFVVSVKEEKGKVIIIASKFKIEV